jgi:hypothetical protein
VVDLPEILLEKLTGVEPSTSSGSKGLGKSIVASGEGPW